MFDLTQLKTKTRNPRKISDRDFEKLMGSVQEFPKMLTLRPIVYDPVTMEVLGGNQRLRALLSAGYKSIPEEWVKSAEDLTEDEKKRFVVQDNVEAGDWDADILKDDYDIEALSRWGVPEEALEEEIDGAKEGEEIRFDKSLQVLPKTEYLIIYADSESEDWEYLRSLFKCRTVRQGGCRPGSSSDKATTGLERVFDVKTFKERVGL